jgi:hypothetical protein
LTFLSTGVHSDHGKDAAKGEQMANLIVSANVGFEIFDAEGECIDYREYAVEAQVSPPVRATHEDPAEGGEIVTGLTIRTIIDAKKGKYGPVRPEADFTDAQVESMVEAIYDNVGDGYCCDDDFDHGYADEYMNR